MKFSVFRHPRHTEWQITGDLCMADIEAVIASIRTETWGEDCRRLLFVADQMAPRFTLAGPGTQAIANALSDLHCRIALVGLNSELQMSADYACLLGRQLGLDMSSFRTATEAIDWLEREMSDADAVAIEQMNT